jgi:hypothetical protein
MAKLVFLILITVLLTLANTTSVMAADANGNIRHDDIMRLSRKKKSTKDDDDVYWLMKDVQFVLRLCLLSELGFELSIVKPIFCIDNMVEARGAREKEN